MKNKTTTGKTSKRKNLTEKNFVVFTAKQFKENPDAYRFNNYSDARKIAVRKETQIMDSFDVYDVTNQLIQRMDENDEIDVSIRFSVEFICKLAEQKKLVINKDKLEDWVQRLGNVAAVTTMSRLIISLINGDACMPEIQTIVGENPENGNLVIFINDGMQRITTLVDFICGNFTLKGTGTILDGCKFTDLPDSIRKILLNRLIRFHVIHESLMDYRIYYFRTLNTTSTKMTMGELINTKYSSYKVTHAARKKFASENVKDVFLPATKKPDIRLNGEAELLFATACHYIYTQNIPVNKVSGKCDMINKFMSLDEVKKYDLTIKRLINATPEVCAKMNYYFGPSFTKRIDLKTKYTTQNPLFPAQYEPYGRKNAVCSTHTNILYFVTMMLFDEFENMPAEAIQEIAMNIDMIFGSDSFIRTYNTSVNAKKIINRMSYVMNEAVNPVLDKYGLDTYATRIEK